LRRCIICLLGLLFVAGVACAAPVLPPGEKLQISGGGENVVQYGSSFYVPSGTAITLWSNRPGIWTGAARYDERMTATINQDSTFTFAANDSQRETVKVFVSHESHCLPKFTSDAVLDEDENRQWFAPGDTFTIRAEYESTDCKFDFNWVVDNNEDGVLAISDPHSSETTVTVVKVPASGIDPVIRGVLSDGYDQPEEIKQTIVVEVPEPPTLNLGISFSSYSVDTIVVSCAGSSLPSDGDQISLFVAQLYYWGDRDWLLVDNRSSEDGSDVSVYANQGEGEYKVVAYIVDKHGSRSQSETRIVEVPATENEIPKVYVAKNPVNCTTNGSCDIDATPTGRHNPNAAFGFYDEQNRRIDCDGPICSINYTQSGRKTVYVRTYLLEDDGTISDDYNEEKVTVNVTQNPKNRTSASTNIQNVTLPASVPAQTQKTADDPNRQLKNIWAKILARFFYANQVFSRFSFPGE